MADDLAIRPALRRRAVYDGACRWPHRHRDWGSLVPGRDAHLPRSQSAAGPLADAGAVVSALSSWRAAGERDIDGHRDHHLRGDPWPGAAADGQGLALVAGARSS